MMPPVEVPATRSQVVEDPYLEVGLEALEDGGGKHPLVAAAVKGEDLKTAGHPSTCAARRASG